MFPPAFLISRAPISPSVPIPVSTILRGEIKIRSYCEDEYAVISIADTGGGIADKHLSKIFDYFYTTKALGRGTGQGLSIACRVVKESHNGDLSFDTELGKGTTFYIKLPLEHEEDAGSKIAV